MITKKDNLKEAIAKYPETGYVLANSGLHCVGCHSAAYESIEDGCLAHGMDEAKIDELIKTANERIKLFDGLQKASFSLEALEQLAKRKKDSKYVKIIPVFGDFDFDATNDLEKDDVVLEKTIGVITDKKVERMIRGTKIDFDKEIDDFTAQRED
jgi:hybrid cluster-associated redox disulfide protein